MVLLFRSIHNCLRYTSVELFGFAKRCYSYESDGKTTVSFLSKESQANLLVTSFNEIGFRLNSGLFVVGPVIMFPKTILSWNVADDDDINEDSLALFYNLEPKLDMIVIGLSDETNSFKNQTKYFKKLQYLRNSKLNVELLPTESAIAAYNFLTCENRYIAAAMIPPKKIDYSKYNFQKFADIGKVCAVKDDYFLGDDIDLSERKAEIESDSSGTKTPKTKT